MIVLNSGLKEVHHRIPEGRYFCQGCLWVARVWHPQTKKIHIHMFSFYYQECSQIESFFFCIRYIKLFHYDHRLLPPRSL